jgi:hypothetical protein
MFISINKSGIVVHACNSTYKRDIGRRIAVPGQQGKTHKTLFKI